MKKIICGFATFALLAMLATSCANEKVESAGDSKSVIAFKAATGKQTLSRAQELTLTALQAKTIDVEAYEKDNALATLYRAFELTYNIGTDKWSYTTPEFHPTYDLVYYSAVPTQTLTADGTGASFDYEVNAVASQEDLIAATTTTSKGTAASATANLVYKHLLSQVNFAVKGLADVKIIITDIELNDVQNSGTYTFGTPGAWALDGATDDYVYEPAGNNYTAGTTDIVYFGNDGDVLGHNTNDNALMLMPQTFAGVTPGSGSFTFHYQMLNTAGANIGEEIGKGDVEVFFGDPALSLNGWEAGKRYLYTLNFQAPDYITFTVDMDPWVDHDGAGGIVNVDVE